MKCTFVNIHKTSFSKSGDVIKVNTLKVVFASLDLIKLNLIGPINSSILPIQRLYAFIIIENNLIHRSEPRGNLTLITYAKCVQDLE